LRRYTFTGTVANHNEHVSGVEEVWKRTQSSYCSITYGTCNPPDYDILTTNFKKLTTDFSSSATSVYYDYLPVVTGDVIGIYITPQSSGWRVAVEGGTIEISNTSGTTYTFNGTLDNAASAINATSSGTLFTAVVAGGIDGSLALVSDLKSFSTDYNQGIGSSGCSIGLPILEAGDLISPFGVSTSPIYDVIANTTPPCYATTGPIVFGQDALDAGFAESPQGYIDWLKSSWSAKWDTNRYNPAPDDSGISFSTSSSLLNSLISYPAVGYLFGGGCSYRYLKDGWSLTGGNSSKSFS
jgi:hypothetical protein